MYYLIKTVTNEGIDDYDTKTTLVMKSSLKQKLQDKVKQLFDVAVKCMGEDDLVNNCSKEDFDNDNGYFSKNDLLIYYFLHTPGMDRETINYAIVSDEDIEEI